MFEEIKSLGRAALGKATHVLDKIESKLNEVDKKLALQQFSPSSRSCTKSDKVDIQFERQDLRAAKELISGSKQVVSALWQTETNAPRVPSPSEEPKSASADVSPVKQEPAVAKNEPKKSNAVFNLVFKTVGETGGELLGAAREVAGYALEGVGTLAWNSVVEVAKTDPKDLARAFVCVHPQLVGLCLAVNYWDLSSAHKDLKKNPTTYNFLRVAWHSLTFSARAVRLFDASAGSGASISSSDEGGTGAGSGAASAGSPAAAAAGSDAATGSESSTSLATVDTGSAAVAIDLYAAGEVGDNFLDLFYLALNDSNWVLGHVEWLGIENTNERLIRHLLAEAHTQLQRINYRDGKVIPHTVTEAMNDQISYNIEDILERLFARYPEAEELIDQLNEALDTMRAPNRGPTYRN